MSDTPLTDAADQEHATRNSNVIGAVPADFARDLERRVAHALTMTETLNEERSEFKAIIKKLSGELEEARHAANEAYAKLTVCREALGHYAFHDCLTGEQQLVADKALTETTYP